MDDCFLAAGKMGYSTTEVGDLVVTPNGMLVVGSVPGSADNHTDTILLATEDGITYEPVSDTVGVFSDAYVTAGTWFHDRIVLVGREPYSETGGGLAYQWVWTP